MSFERRTYMFNVGDFIVYPMHGAGTIDAIEEKDILGEKQSYYILKMPGEVKVMVPTNKAEQIGVRNIIDKSSAEKVFEILEEDETEMSMNWNKRYRDNMEKMKSGDIYEVADVVRNLSFKQKEKGLTTVQLLKAFPRKQRLEIVDLFRGARPLPLNWEEVALIAQVLDISKEEIYDYWEARLKQLLQISGFHTEINNGLMLAMFDCARDYVYKYIKNLRAKIEGDKLKNVPSGGFILTE